MYLKALLSVSLAWSLGNAAVTPAALEADDLNEPVDTKVDQSPLQRRYDDFKLLRTLPTTQDQLEALRFLQKGAVEAWTSIPANISMVRHIDLMVGPEDSEHVLNFLGCSGIESKVVLKNIQEEIDQEQVKESDSDEDDDDYIFFRPGFCTDNSGMNFKRYFDSDTIYKYLFCVAEEHKDKASLHDIGKTYEGRSMYVLKIGRPSLTGSKKPAVWIDGGIHAREWISPATVSYLIYQLVENYGSQQNRFLVDNFDIYVMPLANPDGYEYSRNHDRMWRKTRSKHVKGCIGVDPNRNWGFNWGGKGASTNPCSETYRGPTAFSEPETLAMSNFIANIQRNQDLEMYLTFHSYGQYILYPWGYEAVHAEDRPDLHSMATAAGKAMKAQYEIGSSAMLLYPASGGSDDWAKGSAGVKYSYTIELPDSGYHGFLLPSSRIEEVGQDTHEGVVAMISELARAQGIQ